MIQFLIAMVIYVGLTFTSYHLLLSLSVPIFLLCLYALPLLINFVLYKYQKDNLKTVTAILLPTFSMLYYVAFSSFVLLTGVWAEFVQLNTLVNGDMSVEISTNLFESSQLLFAGVLFYGFSIAYHLFTKRSLTKQIGEKYA
ncbi:Msa family membrane protein [Streptococcus lutetiensis]|uniref:Msa family membrane protein n=1 Tax=Streptococcus lutetiensis TaxID=150055 RepID=UPI0019669928|nr:Msa family membrane protein [Streptococcus lutetiensis]